MSSREGELVSRLRAWVDRGLPDRILAQDATTRRRARLCVVLPLVGSLGALGAVITQLALGRPILGVYVAFGGFLAALFGSQLVRLTGSVRLAGYTISFALFGFLSASAVIAGGLGSPRVYALILAPMLSTLLVGWRVGLALVGLATLEVIAFLLLPIGSAAVAQTGDPETFRAAHAAGVLIVMFFSLLVIASYERANSAVAEELGEALRDADAANRLKSALVANVSHELRTPLNGVLGSTDLLMRSGLDDVQRGYAETIETASEGLLRLVDDLLDMSRLEAGGMDLEAIPLELRRVLGATMSTLAPVAEARAGGRLVLHVEPDVPEHVVGDPYRLRQVLTNLVSNAIKFTDEGHVVLHVSTAHAGIRFEVRDTGVGIAEADRPRLFAAFEQVRASTARQHGGTGLGLNIAERLVTLMGGAIEVTSEEGAGTTFAFELALGDAPADATAFAALEEPETHRVALRLRDPVEAAAAEAAVRWAGHQIVDEDPDVVVHDGGHRGVAWSVRVVSLAELGGRAREEVRVARPFAPSLLAKAVWRAAHQAPSSRPPVSSISGKGRVLVADDTAVNRRVAAGQLGHLGYDTLTVEDGAAAVRAMSERGPFVAVFLDVRMPGMDGYEAARGIRAWEKARGGSRTPVFALTAHEEGGQRARAREAGFDRFLVKPMRIEDFEAVLDAARGRVPAPARQPPVGAWAELEMLASDDPTFLRDLVRSFLTTSAERLEAIEGGGDAREIAHAMKGASKQLGADELATACEALERAPDDVAALLPIVTAELERTRAILLARIGETGGPTA